MNPEELAKKYNLDLKKLAQEQEKLAKQLAIKDEIDFSLIDKIGAVDTAFFQNKIISVCVVLNPEMEMIAQGYFSDKIRFPYIRDFRAYRELPSMIEAFNKLEEKPDVIFVPGDGISHPRLGIASHFSISVGVPTIGISNSLPAGEVKGEYVFFNGKKTAKILQAKPGSNPMYVSPGNNISLNTAYELSKKLIKLPHKLPEPLHAAHKYVREIRKEIFENQ